VSLFVASPEIEDRNAVRGRQLGEAPKRPSTLNDTILASVALLFYDGLLKH
jgi:hypothetical protein